ncbi:MAG: 1-acyl-sn-glycerol-3-phosphate acyltransferase [Pseudomonadota bacterium]
MGIPAPSPKKSPVDPDTPAAVHPAASPRKPAASTSRPQSKQPKLYETDRSRYVGPQRWQTHWWARQIRALWRRRAYTRWVHEACTELHIRGDKHLDAVQGPCILIANHQSHLDTLVTYESLPARIRRRLFFGAAQDRWFLKGQKKTVLKPWYQSLILGNFPILRGGGSEALSYAGELLSKGEHVFLFPEGTRAQGQFLGQFKHGVALLALRCNVPVLPIYLHGLKALRPKGSQGVVPGPATVEFLAPVRFPQGMDVGAATRILEDRMNAAHVRYSRDADSRLANPAGADDAAADGAVAEGNSSRAA